MAVITGPNVQMPDPRNPLTEQSGAIKMQWGLYLHAVEQISFNSTRSGPSASRPSSTLPGRWIGMPYFDTTLGYQINLASVNPDVWVDCNGVVV